MKKIAIVVTALLVLFNGGVAWADVNPLPGSIRIPRDRQTTRAITWALSSTDLPGATYTTYSYSGRFVSGNINLGTVNTTLTAVLSQVSVDGVFEGRVTEALTIPISVIKRAEQAGINQFVYERSFVAVNGIQNTVRITVTTSAVGELTISRMRLYFENGRGEITVRKKEEGLKTFADIYYTGTGLFRGYWQVDNRVISYVNQHLVYGKKFTIETPDIPALPTFSEGTHTVKFIIQNPVQGIRMPKAIYYVRPLEAIQIIPIAQNEPYNMAPLDFVPLTFSWSEEGRLQTFLVEFMRAQDEKPVFSAYTRSPKYAMPKYVLNYYFEPGKQYFWKVKGFDSLDQIAGESDIREFRFKSE